VLAQVERASQSLAGRGIRPHLSVVRVGDDPASDIYVRHKIRACEKVGIASSHIHLPADISQADLLARLDELNADAEVNGILVQLPLSEHHSPQQAIMEIDPRKDVDGFHPHNLGCLVVGRTELEPCTPRGIMTMLRAAGVECRGKNAVVVGRSMIVGRPMVQMLVRADATVTACHKYTEDLADHVRRADIVVVATGVAGLIKGEWVKPGAVIVDVGMTRREDGTLHGDVEFDAARERASLITPVPGGVGPMTVATLMENTIRATCAYHRLAIRRGELCDAADVL
jgi:methylenetetrahydrofolate dehydrogenase (NADP+)/methenyltetrahydrofolate cyclohydrolase